MLGDTEFFDVAAGMVNGTATGWVGGNSCNVGPSCKENIKAGIDGASNFYQHEIGAAITIVSCLDGTTSCSFQCGTVVSVACGSLITEVESPGTGRALVTMVGRKQIFFAVAGGVVHHGTGAHVNRLAAGHRVAYHRLDLVVPLGIIADGIGMAIAVSITQTTLYILFVNMEEIVISL